MSSFACLCTGTIRGLTVNQGAEDLADEDEILVPDGTSGWGYVHVGNDEEFARFTWSNDATVTLREATTNVSDLDVDTYVCIYDGGAGIRIKNRLGTERVFRYLLYYT